MIHIYDAGGDVIDAIQGLFERDKIDEEKNNRRNSNFPRFGSFLAGTSTRPRLPNPMPGKISPMS